MFYFIAAGIILLCVSGAINKSIQNRKNRESRERAIADEKHHVNLVDQQRAAHAINVAHMNRIAQLEQAYRVVFDSLELITQSHNVDTVINRYKDFEKYYPVIQSATNSELRDARILISDSFFESVNEIAGQRDNIINLAIQRSFEYEINDSTSLKTLKCKLKRITTLIDKLSAIESLTDANKRFIEMCANQCIEHIEREAMR